MVTSETQGIGVHHPDYVFGRLVEPDIMADPYPFYAHLRERGRLLLMPTTGLDLVAPADHFCWVTGHEEALAVLRSPEAYRLARLPKPGDGPGPAHMSRLQRAFAEEAMFSVDAAGHLRLRRSLTGYLTPKRVEALRANAQRHCDDAMDRIVEQLRVEGVADLHNGLIRPVAVQTLCDLIGIPGADGAWLEPLIRRMFPLSEPLVDDEAMADVTVATEIVMNYFRDLSAQRRRRPQDDLASALVHRQEEDDDQRRLSQGEVETLLWTILFLGFEANIAAMDNAVLQMLRYPQHATALAGNSDQVDAFVSECLRHDPPTTMTGGTRVTARPLQIGDVVLPENVDIRILTGAVNRDPSAFPDADRFDPGRDTTATFTFANGLRRCIAVHLVTMEMAVVLPKIYTTLPGLRVVGVPPRRHTYFWRVFERMDVSADLSAMDLR